MSDIHDQFKERIERAVFRFLYHCKGADLDATELDGEVTLRFEGGELVALHMPTPSAKGRAAKTAAKAKESAYNPDRWDKISSGTLPDDPNGETSDD